MTSCSDEPLNAFTISLQALVAASIFFVWVVRYGNIIEEFKQYRLPDWVRDVVGILKLTFALMLLIGIERERFRPDMFGQLAIAGPNVSLVSVPATSLVQTPEQTLVYRESSPGKYEPVPVKTGKQSDGQVAILSGLRKGDRVVTDGAMLLRAGTK